MSKVKETLAVIATETQPLEPKRERMAHRHPHRVVNTTTQQLSTPRILDKIELPVEKRVHKKRRHRIPGHRESPTSTSFWTSSATFGNCCTEKTELITNYNKIK